MYIIRLSHRSNGMDIAECEWGGRKFEVTSRHGATMAIARVLCVAGVPDGPWRALDTLTGFTRLYGPSVHALGALTVSEPDTRSASICEYEPFPSNIVGA